MKTATNTDLTPDPSNLQSLANLVRSSRPSTPNTDPLVQPADPMTRPLPKRKGGTIGGESPDVGILSTPLEDRREERFAQLVASKETLASAFKHAFQCQDLENEAAKRKGFAVSKKRDVRARIRSLRVEIEEAEGSEPYRLFVQACTDILKDKKAPLGDKMKAGTELAKVFKWADRKEDQVVTRMDPAVFAGMMIKAGEQFATLHEYREAHQSTGAGMSPIKLPSRALGAIPSDNDPGIRQPLPYGAVDQGSMDRNHGDQAPDPESAQGPIVWPDGWMADGDDGGEGEDEGGGERAGR